jgi:hypothetical protein
MDSRLPEETTASNHSPSSASGKERNSILQTAQAFKSLIDSTGVDEQEHEGEVQSRFSVLSALVHVRSSLRELVEKTKFRKVALVMVEDDAFGWPRMRVRAEAGGNSLCELSVGGQSRREGAVLYFKESDGGTKAELKELEISDREITDKTLRALVRTFFESVKRIVSEKESIEKRVANVLQVLSDDGLESQVAEHNTESLAEELGSVDLFSETDSTKKKVKEADALIDDFDFFSEE